ncbi:hypothetical protein AeMF1_005357 [Aphanomyces euteiches]|nr:hypothetical protein AeMF1_005357 [Aphanomyces euteiches]KAH9182186.1 hypothetical protein AeNC1_015839 [Aphanomyces euteiches]
MQVTYPILGVGQAKEFIAICGGGGSAKTGVKNTVDVYSMPRRGAPFHLLGSADTGSELASSVAISTDGQWVAVSVNATCWIYEAKLKKATEETPASVELVFRIKFRTDFAENEPSQTCACFVGPNTLVTGGEDSVVRVWSLTTDADENSTLITSSSLDTSNDSPSAPQLGDSAAQGATIVRLTREYRGHTKRIKQIHVDPFSRNAIVTSDEAATCHLWRLDSFTAFFETNATRALQQVFTKFPAPKGVHKHQFRCVRFANDGQALYTVLSPPRGDAYLVKWIPATPSQVEASTWPWQIDQVAVAGPEPVGSLCVSDDGAVVVTATASGDLFTFCAKTFTPLSRSSAEDHTFAITGLTCQKAAPGLYRLCSAGADKRLLVHRLEFKSDGLSWRATFGALLLSLVAGAIVALATVLYFHAAQSLLPLHPLQGFEDLVAQRYETNDAMATVMAGAVGLVATIVTWTLCLQSRAIHGLFWVGFASLVLSGLSLWIASAVDMHIQWHNHVDLVEYKTCILSAVVGIVFLLSHSLALMLL